MKYVLALIATVCLLLFFGHQASAQLEEAEQLALDIEKLAQMKSILTEMYDGYKILTAGYNTVKNLAEGNFNLHQDFLNGLLSVSPSIKKYGRVADIITAQASLVKQYKSVLSTLRSSNAFNPDELTYIGTVFSNLFDRSVDNLDELTAILTDSQLRMNDAERLAAIDRIYKEMNDKVAFLKSFSDKAATMAGQRQKATQELSTLQSLFSK